MNTETLSEEIVTNDFASNLETKIKTAHGIPSRSSTITTMLNISREIPENVTDITVSYAEHLSGRFLKGMDICAELYTLAISYELRMSALAKAAFSQAMVVRAVEANLSTARDREQWAYSDQEYLAANEHLIEAKMFKTIVEEKKSVLLKAHHLMKSIVNNDNNNLSEVVRVREGQSRDSKGEWAQRSSWT